MKPRGEAHGAGLKLVVDLMRGNPASGSGLDKRIDPGRLDLETLEDVIPKRGRYPPVHAIGEFRRQIGTGKQWLLKASEALALGNHNFPPAARHPDVGIAEDR